VQNPNERPEDAILNPYGGEDFVRRAAVVPAFVYEE
jgi:hypothetical protein